MVVFSLNCHYQITTLQIMFIVIVMWNEIDYCVG